MESAESAGIQQEYVGEGKDLHFQAVDYKTCAGRGSTGRSKIVPSVDAVWNGEDDTELLTLVY